MIVQAGLCRTLSETQIVGFLMHIMSRQVLVGVEDSRHDMRFIFKEVESGYSKAEDTIYQSY